tara:strand:+ start:89 stop:295 length:207 start_codon:yes stop_codon:yes gene_type:complete
MKMNQTRNWLIKWLLGVLLWFLFDLFMEAVVFEALEWNGTTKNDWFFILWWIVFFFWLLYGLKKIFRF